MVVVNFAHPFTGAQLRTIEQLAGTTIERVLDAPAKFNNDRGFTEQARDLVAAVRLTGAEWQQLPIIVNLPSLSVIAGLVLAELHGLMGHFPAIIRMRPVSDAVVHEFEPVEILNLQSVRDGARDRRQ